MPHRKPGAITRKRFLQASGAGLLGLGAVPSLAGQSATSGQAVAMEVKVHRLSLKHTWTISRNSSDFKDNVFVSLMKDGLTGWGEAAPNVRYQESADMTVERLNRVRPTVEAA